MSRNIRRMPDAEHRDKVSAFVRTLESDPFVRKNLYCCEWVSGSHTGGKPYQRLSGLRCFAVEFEQGV